MQSSPQPRTDKEVFTTLLGTILRQPSMSRRQQLLLAMWAACGKIDGLYSSFADASFSLSSPAVDVNNNNTVSGGSDTPSIQLETQQQRSNNNILRPCTNSSSSSLPSSELLAIGQALCELTSKVLGALTDLLKQLNENKEDGGASSSAAAAISSPTAPFLDFFFAISAHLLRAKVAIQISNSSAVASKQKKNSLHSAAPSTTATVSIVYGTIASHLALYVNPKQVQQCQSFYQQEFINLLGVSGGVVDNKNVSSAASAPSSRVASRSQSPIPAAPPAAASSAAGGGGPSAAHPPYTLIVEKSSVCKGHVALIYVIAILAAFTTTVTTTTGTTTTGTTAAADHNKSCAYTTAHPIATAANKFFGPKTLVKTIELLTRFLSQKPPSDAEGSLLCGVIKDESLHPSEILLKRVEVSEHYAAASLAASKALKDLFLLSSSSSTSSSSGSNSKKKNGGGNGHNNTSTLFSSIECCKWSELPPFVGACATSVEDGMIYSQMGGRRGADDDATQLTQIEDDNVNTQPSTGANNNSATDDIVIPIPNASSSADNFFLSVVVRQKLFGTILPLLAEVIPKRIAAEATGELSQQLSGRNSVAFGSGADGAHPTTIAPSSATTMMAMTVDGASASSASLVGDQLTQSLFQDSCRSAINVNALLWVLDTCLWVVEDGLSSTAAAAAAASSATTTAAAASALIMMKNRVAPTLNLIFDVLRAFVVHSSDVDATTISPLLLVPTFAARIVEAVSKYLSRSVGDAAAHHIVDDLSYSAANISSEQQQLLRSIIHSGTNSSSSSFSTRHPHSDGIRGDTTTANNSAANGMLLLACDPFALTEHSSNAVMTLISRLMRSSGSSSFWPCSLWASLDASSSGSGGGNNNNSDLTIDVNFSNGNIILNTLLNHLSSSKKRNNNAVSRGHNGTSGSEQLGYLCDIICADVLEGYHSNAASTTSSSSSSSSSDLIRHQTHSDVFTATHSTLSSLVNSYVFCYYLRVPLVSVSSTLSSSTCSSSLCSALVIQFVCHPSTNGRLALPKKVLDGVIEWKKRRASNNNYQQPKQTLASAAGAQQQQQRDDLLLCRSSTEITSDNRISSGGGQQQQQPKRNSFELPPPSNPQSRRMSFNLSIVGGTTSMSRPSERFDLGGSSSGFFGGDGGNGQNHINNNGGGSVLLGNRTGSPPPPFTVGLGNGDIRSTTMHVDFNNNTNNGTTTTTMTNRSAAFDNNRYSDDDDDEDDNAETQQVDGYCCGGGDDGGNTLLSVSSPLRRQKKNSHASMGVPPSSSTVVPPPPTSASAVMAALSSTLLVGGGGGSGGGNNGANNSLLLNSSNNLLLAGANNNSLHNSRSSTPLFGVQQQQQPKTAAASVVMQQQQQQQQQNGLSASSSLSSAAPHHPPPLASTIASVEALLMSLKSHSNDHATLQQSLNESNKHCKRLSDENNQLRRNFQKEIQNVRQDNSLLKEQLATSKKEALEASAHFANEMMLAMKRLEERNNKIAELEAMNNALNNRVKRQEAKTMQMLSMLNSE